MNENNLHRREWIQTTAGLAVGSLFTSFALAQTQGHSPIQFTVITDTHLGRKDNDSAKRQWEKTAADLATTKSAFVLHLGDVVDGGRVNQYPIYKEIRKQIPVPVYEIPGNHDPDEAFAKHLRKEIDTIVQHDWLSVVLMGNAHSDSHDGFFTTAQLDWLEKQCSEAVKNNKLVLICCHVPVHSNRHPDRGWYVKPDQGQKRFYEIVTQYKDRLLGTFHGHFHNGLRGWDDRKPFHEICFPSALYNLKRGLEEKKAPGYNPDEFRPGYANVTIGNGKMTIAYQATSAESKIEKILDSVSQHS